MEKKENIFEKYFDKILTFFLSNDSRKWLVLIIILGFILRFIVASNGYNLADEFIHGTHAINFIEKGSISHMTQCPLWFYLTSIFYSIFGVHQITMRMMSLLFGTFSIIPLYLLTKLLFNKRVALLASFLLAISPFVIRYTLSYMDQSMIFFILFAIYLFIKKFKEEERISLLAAVMLGLAALIKIIAANFIFVFGIFMLIICIKKYKADKKWINDNFPSILLFILIVFLLFSPVFTYNYLLYKDKGVVDLPFAMYFDINKDFYQGPGLAHETGFSAERGFLNASGMFKSFLELSPITFILFFFGLFLTFKSKSENKKYIIFLLALFLTHYLVLIFAIGLQTHYSVFITLFSMFGAVGLMQIKKDCFKKFKSKKTLPILLLIFLCLNLFILSPFLFSTNGISKMRGYAMDNIDKSSLVVVDTRIYRGGIAWTFNDYHYIESSYFPDILMMNENSSSQKTLTKLYFIECATDDCGWGTITKGGLNDSSEALVDLFSAQANLDKTFYGGGGDAENKPYFKIYSTEIMLDLELLEIVDSTHEWFFYPVRYEMKDKIYDKYEIHTNFDNFLNNLAFIIIYLSIFLALFSIVILVYYLVKDIK
ncbi:MAG: glycosyltransferase family 39 protein [Candidatus Pacearchaeota archaeon]|nr:glycosyltransferase family 39 protein [Candidatus Pacearchaeota archaeon]